MSHKFWEDNLVLKFYFSIFTSSVKRFTFFLAFPEAI